jgi:anti-sigma regulatory factor (Ser/Thr protein kinase)
MAELTHVEIARVIRDIAEGLNNENVDLMKLRLDYVNRMTVTLGLSEEVTNALSFVYQQLDRISEIIVESRDVDVQYRPSVIHSGRGRPRISIPQEQLSFLVDQGFTVKEMSNILGAGQRTIERRLAAFDISIKGEQMQCTMSKYR